MFFVTSCTTTRVNTAPIVPLVFFFLFLSALYIELTSLYVSIICVSSRPASNRHIFSMFTNEHSNNNIRLQVVCGDFFGGRHNRTFSMNNIYIIDHRSIPHVFFCFGNTARFFQKHTVQIPQILNRIYTTHI